MFEFNNFPLEEVNLFGEGLTLPCEYSVFNGDNFLFQLGSNVGVTVDNAVGHCVDN